MTARTGRRLARIEAAQGCRQGVHVFQVPHDLDGKALARWKADTTAGIPKTATVVWVELRDAEMT